MYMRRPIFKETYPAKTWGLLLTFCLLVNFNLYAQKDKPCECAQRWERGARWNANGSITEFPASNHIPPQGVVSCHPSAQTQSQVTSGGCVYNPGHFKIDLAGHTCINPRTG